MFVCAACKSEKVRVIEKSYLPFTLLKLAKMLLMGIFSESDLRTVCENASSEYMPTVADLCVI